MTTKVKGVAVGKLGEDDDLLDTAKDIRDQPPEVQEMVYSALREAIRAGQFKFSDEAKAQMVAKGVTEEEILEGIMKQAGLDS